MFKLISKAVVHLLPVLLLLCGILPLKAQYNEQQILTQQAYQLLARRQFNEAEQAFLQILTRFPNDSNSVLQLMQIYLQTSQLTKAETLLNEQRRILSPNLYTEQSILLTIHQGRAPEALSMAQNYLEQLGHDQAKYRQLASFFEQRSFYEQSLILYQAARDHFANQDLFTLESANAALNFRRLDLALSKYLQWLKLNPNNLYFVNNQVKTILQEDSGLIEQIGTEASNNQLPALWELYAGALQSLNRNLEALEAFKHLPEARMQRFTEELIAAGNYDIALLSLAHLKDSASSVIARADYVLKMSQVLFSQGDIEASTAVLDSLLAEPELDSPQFRNGSRVNYQARKLLAELQINKAVQMDSVFTTLESMRRYARGAGEQSEASLQIAKLHLMNSGYESAERALDQVLDNQQFHTREYYRILSSMLRLEIDVADSLLNEMIIAYPSSPWINDLIGFMMIVLSIPEDSQASFMRAFQAYNLRQEGAIALLLEVYGQTSDEEILILASEWAAGLGKREEAIAILNHEFTDPISAEYAGVLRLNYTQDIEAKSRVAREFLSENPTSVFSPGFRAILSRGQFDRPQR